MIRWTPEELEEMRRADEEIEAEFCETDKEIVESHRRDMALKKTGKKKKETTPEQRARATEKARKRREADPEKYKAMQRQAYLKNRDYILAQHREYSKAHREERNAYERKYYAEHREKILNRMKEYREKNPDKCRAYQAKYRERKREGKLREKALRQANAGTEKSG